MKWFPRRMVGDVVQSTFLVGLALASLAGVFAGEAPARPARDPCASGRGIGAFKPLSEIQAQPVIQGKTLPADCSGVLFGTAGPVSRDKLGREEWSTSVCSWAAPELCYHPLYFDDAPLERYGQTAGRWLQPALSGVHFFGNVAALPYKMVADHPSRHISPLGYERPGSAAPAIRERLLRPRFDPLWFHPLAWRPQWY